MKNICLVLFGLVSFMAVQRTKEVGIRKTLGASVGHIVYLFSKEFTLLILVAFVISAPLGWYLMNKWNLKSIVRRKYRIETTGSKHTYAMSENYLERLLQLNG